MGARGIVKFRFIRNMIGIVGGAGPVAGINLLRKLIEETKAAADQDHLPVLLWSTPEVIPDRTRFLEGDLEQNPGIPIGRILLNLEKNGATVAGIACNTAHAPRIFSQIQMKLEHNNSRIKVLNIIEETVRFIRQTYSPGSKIGVLSTTGTWRSGLYRDALKSAGFEVISTTESDQQQVHRAVYDPNFGVKATGISIADKSKEILYGTAARLISEGAEVLVLGCTEIPLVIKESTYKEVPVLDTLRILARALIAAYAPEKLRPLNP